MFLPHTPKNFRRGGHKFSLFKVRTQQLTAMFGLSSFLNHLIFISLFFFLFFRVPHLFLFVWLFFSKIHIKHYSLCHNYPHGRLWKGKKKYWIYIKVIENQSQFDMYDSYHKNYDILCGTRITHFFLNSHNSSLKNVKMS